MHVNPVIPPVDRFRRKIEKLPLLGGQRRRKQPRVLALEDMLVVQNERFVKPDELFRANQLAFRLGERRFLQPQRRGYSINP